MRLQLAFIVLSLLAVPLRAQGSNGSRAVYPVPIVQRVGCLEKIRAAGLRHWQLFRGGFLDSLPAALERFGVRSELGTSRQLIEPYIDQYLAVQKRYLLATRAAHPSHSRAAKLIAHQLQTLETGVPTATTPMARTFLRIYYPRVSLRGYPPALATGTAPDCLLSPLDQLSYLFEGFDPQDHGRAMVFIEALMTDIQLDFLERAAKPAPRTEWVWRQIQQAQDK